MTFAGFCKCPACRKTFERRQDVLLHFRQALYGYDHLWDSTAPHVSWARQRGIRVDDGSNIVSGDKDKLKQEIYRWLETAG